MTTETSQWIGQQLSGGRYVVQSQLGAGGMGFIYLAQDQHMQRPVVIKAPRRSMLDDPEFAGRFTRESRALVRLSHPHIVTVHDLGEHQGVPFMVLDYLKGGSLTDRQKKLKTPAQRVADLPQWLPGVAQALDYMHAQGYIHRDVKPDNILFDEHGHVYLSDFGIAKALLSGNLKGNQTVLTGAGMVLGTPQYMAPELIVASKYDGRVDQYGLAASVYQFLSGKPPIDGETPLAIIAKQATHQPVSLKELARSIPPAISANVQRGLAKEAGKRFGSCNSFAEAVFRGDAPPAATPAPTATSAPAATTPRRAQASAVSKTCPYCQQRFRVGSKQLGQKVSCPHCRSPVQTVAPVPLGQPAMGKLDSKRQQGARKPAPTRQPGLLLTGRWHVLIVISIFVFVACAAIFAAVFFLEPWNWSNETDESPKFVTNSIGMKLVLIPAGEFMMGSPITEKDRAEDEGPQHQVRITRPYYMGVYEVTQSEYQKVMGTNPSFFSRTNDPAIKKDGGGQKNPLFGVDTSNFPVEQVTWNNAVEFCRRLSEFPRERDSGRIYRLPTEAEWEYVCRAGAESYQVFHYGNSLSSTQANFDGENPYGTASKGPNLKGTIAVGSFQSNAFGVYDMHGNVWEWCNDWYAADFYGKSPSRDPISLTPGTFRVIRGGGWMEHASYCRAATRHDNTTSIEFFRDLGFRVVCGAVK